MNYPKKTLRIMENCHSEQIAKNPLSIVYSIKSVKEILAILRMTI